MKNKLLDFVGHHIINITLAVNQRVEQVIQ